MLQTGSLFGQGYSMRKSYCMEIRLEYCLEIHLWALTFVFPNLSPTMAVTHSGKAKECSIAFGGIGQSSMFKINRSDLDK